MEIATITAPNRGAYTGDGTNSYILHSAGESLVVDPGPDIASHLDHIREALDGVSPVAVVATHHHFDHTESIPTLAAELQVPSYGFGGEESFRPSRSVTDGEVLRFGEAELTVVHTPGHTPDSICLLAGRRLFAGDTVKGGSTVVVEDMGAYMASLERLIALEIDNIYPGHGDGPVGPGILDEYLSHRRRREQQVAAAVRHGNRTIGDLIRAVYGDLDPALEPLAARSLQSHLEKLQADGKLSADGEWLGG